MLPENEDLLSRYLTTRVFADNTVNQYSQALLSWDRKVGTPLVHLTKEDLMKWYNEVKKEYSSGTVWGYGSKLRTYHAFILEEKGLSKRKAKSEADELFDVIPFKDLTKRNKRETNLRDQLVTPSEFQAIMKAAQSQRMVALLSITYESGCRKGEIFSLRLKDIQVQDQYWTLSVEGKTGTRTVPIINSIPYLRAWMQLHPDRDNQNAPLFMTTHRGKHGPMSPKSFNSGLRRICETLGIRHLHPHQLRHTRLTKLAENGIGEYQLKSFAGWTPSSAMASRYVHLSGRGHVNAVLEAGGMEVELSSRETVPMLELSRCPNCDRQVDPDMVTCPYCQFILDVKLGISQGDRVSELEAKLEALVKLVEKKQEEN